MRILGSMAVDYGGHATFVDPMQKGSPKAAPWRLQKTIG
jgi:hypothetical protein